MIRGNIESPRPEPKGCRAFAFLEHSMKNQPELPQFIRAREVQAMLGGISRETLRQLVNTGAIPAPSDMNSRLQLYDLRAVVEAVRSRARNVAA
jgi:predicted DNA-binding transcriptional regulator AlpA